jgi:hypothetical protein
MVEKVRHPLVRLLLVRIDRFEDMELADPRSVTERLKEIVDLSRSFAFFLSELLQDNTKTLTSLFFRNDLHELPPFPSPSR